MALESKGVKGELSLSEILRKKKYKLFGCKYN